MGGLYAGSDLTVGPGVVVAMLEAGSVKRARLCTLGRHIWELFDMMSCADLA